MAYRVHLLRQQVNIHNTILHEIWLNGVSTVLYRNRSKDKFDNNNNNDDNDNNNYYYYDDDDDDDYGDDDDDDNDDDDDDTPT